MATSSFDPVANGAVPFDPLKEGAIPIQSQQDPNEGALTRGIEKTGAYDIPLLGGILRGATQPANQLLETGADDVMGLINKLSGNKAPYQAQFISPNEKQALLSPEARQSNPVTNAVGYEAKQLPSQAGAILSADGLAALPSIAKNIPTAVSAIPKYITKGSTFNQMKNAVEGATPNWENVVNAARKDTADETVGVKKALETLIKGEDPSTPIEPGVAGTEDLPTGPWTGNQALNLRIALGKKLPSNIFDALNPKAPSSDEKAAINILRRAVSGELKDAAPKIVTPDNVYKFYSKIKGDIPTWGRRLVISHLASQLLPKEFKGPVSDAVGALLEMGTGF